MRLGVEAAVVDGVLLRGDVEVADGRMPRRPGVTNGSGIAARVRRPRERFGGATSRRRTPRPTSRRAALLETGVTAFHPTLITAPDADIALPCASCPPRPIARASRKAPSIPFSRPHGSVPTRRGSARSGSRPSGAAARRRPVSQRRWRGAARRARADRALHGHGVLFSLAPRTDRREAGRGFDRGVATVTPSSTLCAVRAPRPGHRRRGLARYDLVVQLILDGHHLAE